MQKANREEVKSNRQHSGSRIVVVRVKNDAWRRFGLSATAAAFFNPNGRWLLARGGILADWMIFYTIRGLYENDVDTGSIEMSTLAASHTSIIRLVWSEQSAPAAPLGCSRLRRALFPRCPQRVWEQPRLSAVAWFVHWLAMLPPLEPKLCFHLIICHWIAPYFIPPSVPHCFL